MELRGNPENSLDRETKRLGGKLPQIIAKNGKTGPYFEVGGNVITGVNFEGSIAYECILDKFRLWEIFPDVDLGNLEYWKSELKICSNIEIQKLRERFGELFHKLDSIDASTQFVVQMQNRCISILNSDK